jgi:hypothetical protein
MRRLGFAGLVVALLGLLIPASAMARDRDRDGLPDRWEKRHGLSTHARGADLDPDRDRVDNHNEYRQRTDPRDRDSDGDGRPDGREDGDRDRLANAAEDQTGNDPRDRDTDDDGVIDGREQAGTVVSFEDGELVLDLAGGGRVSGLADEDTAVYCESEKEAEQEWAESAARARSSITDEEDGDLYVDDEDAEDEEGDFGDEDWEVDDGDFEEDLEWEDDLEDEDTCPLSRLKPGARVHEAELEIGPDGAWFVAIELLR